MAEWVRIGWHLDGMTYDRYLDLSWNDRFALQVALSDQIEATEPDGPGPARPKDLRR